MRMKTSSEVARVYVVVPTYNEGGVLRKTIGPLLESGYSVVVVDDGSTDETEDKLRDLAICYVRHPVNLGQGAALQTGMEYALLHGAEIIVHFDADGQHPSGQIQDLINPIRTGECDVTMGSRFLRADFAQHVPRSKRILLRVGTLVSWLFTGVWLSDTHNGFRALSRRAAKQICLTEDGFAHATEILSAIRKANLKYREVAVDIRYDEYSRQKGQRAWNSLNIVFDLLVRKFLG